MADKEKPREHNPFGSESEQTERGGGEFWPANTGGDEGETILGKLSDLRKIKTRLGLVDVATFSPCVVRSKDGQKEAFHEIQILLSTFLQSRIRTGDIGNVLAVMYDGKEKQPGGNEAHVFRVFDSKPERLAQELKLINADLPF